LEHVAESKYRLFILETNGILLGADRDYARQLSPFADKLYVRVSFKAATPEGFTERTGALGTFVELPFNAMQYLLEEGIFSRAAAMTDPKVMPTEEREILIEKLSKIDPEIAIDLEEEQLDPYETTMCRIRALHDAKFSRELEKTILERK
jgi:uncharacterized Fe-S cluster-containing radical SAM superfamily protein